jgi:hypothetical protein
MGGRERSRKGLVVLGAAVAGLAFWNWHLAFGPVDISPLSPEASQAQRPSPQEPKLFTPLDKKPALAFRETVSRPLFVRDRKPIRRDQAPAKAEVPVNMRLVGVVKIGDEPGRALIRMASEPKGKWIAEGEQIDGFKVRQVTARSAIVEFAGRSHELTLPNTSRAVEGEGEPDAERREQ